MRGWIEIGNIGRPFGLVGGCFLSGRRHLLELRLKGLELRCGLRPESPQLRLVVQSQKVSGGRDVLAFKEVTSRAEVEPLRGHRLWVNRDDLVLESEDEYLWDDLIGRTVLDADHCVVGEVKSVANYGASDVLSVANEQGESIDLPFVAAYFDQLGAHRSGPLQMIVSISIFDGCWV